jgi:transcriptional regulator with XRE-family HTH domain
MPTTERTTNPIPLRVARERAKLSQVALAARAGCAPSTVSIIERGSRLTRRMAKRFAAVLGCDVADIFRDDENER